jgi:hypothetical protein
MSDSRRGFGVEIRFIDHFNSAVAALHTLRITTAHAKSFQCAFISRFPVTDLNNGDSLTAQTTVQFCYN